MNFIDLYNRAIDINKMPITFDSLRDLVNAHSDTIGRVDLYSIDYPKPNHQAHFKLGYDRTSAYDDEFLVAEIFFCSELKKDLKEFRFSITKELMHIFDSKDALVSTREQFEELLRDIQNKPIESSPALNSELAARWMAAIILCPRQRRNELVEDYRAGRISDFDVAEIFEVPEWIGSFVMDDYYDEAWDIVTGGAPRT